MHSRGGVAWCRFERIRFAIDGLRYLTGFMLRGYLVIEPISHSYD